MKIPGLLFAALIALPAQAQTSDSPFYTAFRKYCADTGADPDRVKAAVEAAPLSQGGNTASPASIPLKISANLWSVTVDGHAFTIQSTQGHIPLGPPQGQNIIICAVSSSADEDAGIAAIRDWAGIPPEAPSSSGRARYNFRQDGPARTRMEGNAALMAALAEGNYWSLTLDQNPGFAMVQLLHYGVPPAANTK